MNKAFMDQITAILASAQGAATSIGLAVKAEVPELCRQIVAWEIWSNVVYAAMWLAAAVVMIRWSLVAVKWLLTEKPAVCYGSPEYKARESRERVSVITLVTTAFVLLGGVPSVVISALETVKACVAPDLVILDYVKAAVAAIK